MMGFGVQWHQLDHMQTICTSLQTDNHASTPPISFLQAGCPSCRPTNSINTLKAHILHEYTITEGLGDFFQRVNMQELPHLFAFHPECVQSFVDGIEPVIKFILCKLLSTQLHHMNNTRQL